MNEKLQKFIRQYCLIAIKKVLKINKIKDEAIEKRQRDIISEIKNSKEVDEEFVEFARKLENEFDELEFKKTVIDYDILRNKAIAYYSEKYERELVTKTTNKVLNFLKQQSFSVSSFRTYENRNKREKYRKNKGSDVLTNKEKALKVAKIKREKSLNIVNNIYLDLLKNDKKITAAAIYEIIKNDFNDCLKLRQLNTYLKEIKDANKNIVDCKNMSLEEIEEIINR